MTALDRPPDVGFTAEGRPRFTADQAAALAVVHFGLEGRATPLPAEWDQNFLLDAGAAGRFVIKIANRAAEPGLLDFQNRALRRLAEGWDAGASPRVIAAPTGDLVCTVTGDTGDPHWMRVLSYLEGDSLSKVATREAHLLESIGRGLGRLDACLRDFAHAAMERGLRWDLRQGQWISACTKHIPDHRKRGIVERLLLQFRGRAVPLLDDLPMSVIHNDANDENILIRRGDDGAPEFAGLLDFGDMIHTNTVNELAIAAAYAILGRDEPLDIIAALTNGYHRERPLEALELQALFPLICLRLCISVTNSAMAARDDPDNAHRLTTDAPAWDMLQRLETIDWLEAENRCRAACGFSPRSLPTHGHREWTPETLREARSAHLGPSLSLSYREPLEIVRGQGQYLFEPDERANLDCVNNVCHVGHAHPKVVEAMARQAALLNTNTRYLHPLILEYAERLTATLPGDLSVCYFVNSGSEANELAVRIARTITGRRDAIVLDHGYHGNTQTLVDLSPYKCEGPGGKGLPEWVHKVEQPDPYRGRFRGRGRDEEAGRMHAAQVGELCARLTAEGRPPGLFIAEPIIGCGGQVVPPEGCLRHSFEHVRACGGLCIADEVQVGMGRAGSHWWVFEAMGARPDIVTMGKPIGNGHPLGAVVTTPEIADAFANGMEYFSTFGGNPVSMAVGLAVLDVIEEEGLRDRANRVGACLMDDFRSLIGRFPGVGDVRGIGMFMGVELIRDPETLEPATEETAALIELVKADGVLLSAEGPHHNVLKIKPPLAFDETDADLLLGAVARALQTIRQGM